MQQSNIIWGFVAVVSGVLYAGPVVITSATATQTQIVIQYVATSTGPCTIAANDTNGGVNPPNDVNPTLFPGANTDLARTAAAGFRWPTEVATDGVTRTVIIGGHDEVKLAADGRWYSTALQVNTLHWITLTCNGGKDSSTFDQSTYNIPLGSYYPELPIPAANAPLSGMPQPTIDWSDRTKKYIDPITGVLIQRISSPLDSFDDTNPFQGTYLSPVIDVNGIGQWSNANNFVTKQAAGTLASTSVPNAPLFAAVIVNPQAGESFTDWLVTPYGSASSSSVVSEWCLSTDSGQTCANYTPLDVTFATQAQCQPTGNCGTSVIPSAAASSNFSGWGGMRVAFGTYDLQNQTSSGWTASASGSTITIDQQNVYPGFNLDRVPGSKFYLSACASGSNTMLTVAAVNSTNQITVRETGLNLSGCSYQDYAVGVRVTLKSTGTLNVSFQLAAWAVRGYGSASNASYYPCARTKVTDIQIDCDGKTQSPPLSGYLCMMGRNIYLLQDNGRVCLQSNGYYNTGTAKAGIDVMQQQFLFTDSHTYLAKGLLGQPPRLWKVQHVPNNYTEYQPDPTHALVDNFTYTDISNLNPITPQIAATNGPVAKALATGLWPAMGVDQLLDDGNGGTVIQYRSTAGPQNSLCLLAWADAATNTLKNSLALFGSYPFSTAACHFSPDGGAGYSKVGVEAEDSQVAPFFADSTVLLGGPFISTIKAIHQRGSTWNGWSIPITAAKAASPALLTSPNNDLANIRAKTFLGTLITCSGGTGSWTAVNGNFYAHRVDNNTFTLFTDPQGKAPLDATTFGPLTGSVTCSMAPPLYSIRIGGVESNSGNARMTADLTDGYSGYFVSQQMVMRDGDPITITQQYLNSTTQYYAKVSGAGTGKFDVYTDAALTSPALYSSLSGVTGWYATYAERCPDPATLNLPGPMYMDTGIGTTGPGNQKIRCYTMRLNTEPESDFPAKGEHAAYPPPSASAEASNANKSMLHQINVGDAFGDITDFPFSNHELSYVLAVDRTAGENQIDVTVVRGYGDDPNYGWRGTTNGISIDTYAQQHPIGWEAWQEAAIPAGLVSTSSGPQTYLIPPMAGGGHSDTVSGTLPGTITQANSYTPSVPDDLIDVTPSQYISGASYNHKSFPYWGTGLGYAYGPTQSYPSKRTVPGQAADTEMVWKGDWMAMNPAIGNTQNNGDNLGWSRNITNIRGTSNDSGSTTTNVWKITTISSIYTKLAPVLVQNVPHAVYADISGPNSLITDADSGKYCIAYTPGECRPNSSPQDVFFAGTGFFNWPNCRSNEATLGTPCAFGLWPGAGWAVQVRMNPMDTNSTAERRLTMGGWLPPNHYSFSNWVASPDGKWGFFAGNPIQQRPRKGAYEGTHWFVMKLPPWPGILGFGRGRPAPDRTNFVQWTVQVWGQSGDSIRVEFGYGENGDPSNFYCTTRHEACWTSSAASAMNPYVFASEPQGRTNCNLACSVPVPAIAGRVLYYRVEHANGTIDPVRVVGIP